MKRFRIVSLLLILALLAGCSGLSSEELYCLPEAPEDYYDLQEALSAVLSDGYAYHAPASGARREPVQLVDLDSDGMDEAVAFFRGTSDGAVKTYIFSKQNGVYETAAVIDCVGSAVASVEYADLSGDGSLELLIACQLSETVTQALQVCRYVSGEALMLETLSCNRYVLADLGSGGADLYCVVDNGSDPGTISGYRLQSGQISPSGEVKLSGCYSDLLRIQEIFLADGTKALAVSLSRGESQTVYDVFTLEAGNLIQVKARQLQSENLRGGILYPQDIDGDGTTEIPNVEELPAYDEGASAQSVVQWYGLDAEGNTTLKASTYHDLGGSWYLTLPESWQDQILVKQTDRATAVSSVSTAAFYRLDEQGKAGEEILTIYTLRGTDRQTYAEEQDLNILYSSAEIVYATSINEGAALWEGSITMAQVSEGFHAMDGE